MACFHSPICSATRVSKSNPERCSPGFDSISVDIDLTGDIVSLSNKGELSDMLAVDPGDEGQLEPDPQLALSSLSVVETKTIGGLRELFFGRCSPLRLCTSQ